MRNPPRDAMLSYATRQHGRGWVYAVHTALDQGGLTVGPLVIALVLFLGAEFRTGYALLIVSAILALASLALARLTFPVPSKLEERHDTQPKDFTAPYWIYMFAGALFAAGLMSFELISLHLSSTGTVAAQRVPLLLALSTGIGAILSLVFGRLYDRVGLPGVIPQRRRNLGFGLFYAGYGVGWLIGGVATGFLYEYSPVALVVFAISAQIASLPLFFIARRLSASSG